MTDRQSNIVLFYALVSALFAVVGFIKSYKHKQPSSFFIPLNLIGAFVWADAFVFGIFWALFSAFSIIVDDWLLFLLGLSVFWAVRSWGEAVYWFIQQFSGRKLNPPHRLFLSKYFPGESIWFVYQIYYQCIMVVAIILSIHFASLWLT